MVIEYLSLILALAALAYTLWVYVSNQKSYRTILAHATESEDAVRARFSPEDLAYFDERFEELGIARKVTKNN